MREQFLSRPCNSRGVAQPGRAPGSGPGGRRFKSSLPDHIFKDLKLYFWLPVYVDDVDFVGGSVFLDPLCGIHVGLRTDFTKRVFKERSIGFDSESTYIPLSFALEQRRCRSCKDRKDGAPTVLEREGEKNKGGLPAL